ncbi:uncharacterized protein LOC144381572 [Halichoerus grypus]
MSSQRTRGWKDSAALGKERSRAGARKGLRAPQEPRRRRSRVRMQNEIIQRKRHRGQRLECSKCQTSIAFSLHGIRMHYPPSIGCGPHLRGSSLVASLPMSSQQERKSVQGRHTRGLGTYASMPSSHEEAEQAMEGNPTLVTADSPDSTDLQVLLAEMSPEY